MTPEIKKLLDDAVMKMTVPFCYLCYIEAPSGVCKRCGNDDLMRLLPGCGCEYGTETFYSAVIEELEIEPADTSDERYEEVLDEIYGNVTIAGTEHGTGHALKGVSFGDFQYMKDEYFSDGEEFVEIDGKVYNISDLTEKIEKLEDE